MPRISASPMLPPPRKPIFLPLTDMRSPPSARATRPARPKDRGADPHDGGALLDRYLEVSAHAHREVAQVETEPPPACRVEELPELPVVRARLLGVLGQGRNGHEPPQPEPRQAGHRLEGRAERRG